MTEYFEIVETSKDVRNFVRFFVKWNFMKLYETSQNVRMRTLVVRTGIGSRNSKKLFVNMRETLRNFAKIFIISRNYAKLREIMQNFANFLITICNYL